MQLTQRPSLSKILVQAELNRFYEKPIAQVSLGLALSLICVIFFAIVAIKPTLETMSDLIKQIAQKQDVNNKLSTKIIALSTAQSQLAAKSDAAKFLYIAVPPTPDFSNLLLYIEKLASEQSVTYDSFQITKTPLERSATGIETASSASLESIPFTLTFEGQYSNLSALLLSIENIQRIIVVDQIDFLTPPTKNNTNTLLMNLSVRAFAFNKTGAVLP